VIQQTPHPEISHLELVSEQEAVARLLLRLRAKGFDNSALFSALEQTPRRIFVTAIDADLAYSNRVIPIACGEYIERFDEQIAIITALQLEKKHRVLEIGTGSGFSAAIMARLVDRLTTIERYKTLCHAAQAKFQQLKLDNIILHQGPAEDVLAQMGVQAGSFDRIILWPAVEETPKDFIDMLAGNGILIAPVGAGEEVQTLIRYIRVGSHFESTPLFDVRYQPMIKGLSEVL